LDQLIQTVILSIIQGLTEWLPISSTGHLEIFRHLLNSSIPALFEIILHIGTLSAVLLFFRKDIKNLLVALARLDFKTEDGQLIPLIAIATLPTAILGVAYFELAEDIFQNILPVAIAFILCGTLLYSSKASKEKTDNITYLTAIAIGIAQGIATVPGISRSGATITVALLLGIRREKAFTFSFLLSIPAILGALLFTFYKQHDQLSASGIGWADILVGLTVTMIVGYLALKLLRKIVVNRKFHLFAFYCWLLGALILVFSLNTF
jgi:undecaprenyl-diphosphatase